MKTIIYCEISGKGEHSFYLKANNEKYFLFRQNYRKSVQKYFMRGIRIEEIGNFSRCHKDYSIIRTLDKLPIYIKYLEKEYRLVLLNQTKKRNENYSNKLQLCA